MTDTQISVNMNSVPPQTQEMAGHNVFTPLRGISQPTSAEVRLYHQLHISTHPVIAHKLTELRRVDTKEKRFDELVSELSGLLAYEAMQDLQTQPVQTETPLESCEGYELSPRVALVPIVRAGLSMVSGFRQLIPEARVWHLGLYKDQQTLKPVEYYNRLATQAAADVCFILDPMLAAGGSASRAIEILKNAGAGCIKYVGLIAAPYGVKQVVGRFPDVAIHVGALDPHLNEQGFILPGLGDAGDRQFGTV
jgi:uracil phosphoribosyltransferase